MKNLRVRGLVPQFDKVQLYDPKEAGWSGWKQYLRTISDFDVNLIFLLAVTLSYYGLSYISAALPGNLFINNTINELVETLAYTVLMFAMPFIGRRKLTSGTFLLGGAIILICAILLEFADGRQSMLDAAQWLSFVGKFFVSGCFG